MIDKKFLISNFDNFLKNISKRENIELSLLDKISLLIAERLKALKLFEELQGKRNTIAKQLSNRSAFSDKEFVEISSQAKDIKENAKKAEEDLNKIEVELDHLASLIPNLLQDSVPYKPNVLENVIVKEFIPSVGLTSFSKEHVDIGNEKNYFDFERAVKIAGTRFVITKGKLARFERKLASFMLNRVRKFGFEEHSVPYLVNEESAFRAGQLPKFEEDIFKTTDGRYLIPTAETVICNLFANEFLSEEELPLRITAFTPCFRSEAGSAGRDTRGLIRVHQFQKVEIFSITKPENSEEEQEKMKQCVESILQDLNLPYRIALLCAQDTGFCSSKTFDFEVWMPSQNCYREISSCSNTTNFQSRRANIKYKNKQNEKFFPHMLNCSSLPIGRTVAAILENHGDIDGFDALFDAEEKTAI